MQVQRSRGGAEQVQRCRGAGVGEVQVQRCRGAEVQVQSCRHAGADERAGAKVQRCRDAEQRGGRVDTEGVLSRCRGGAE